MSTDYVEQYTARLIAALTDEQRAALDSMRAARCDRVNANGAWTIAYSEHDGSERAYLEFRRCSSDYDQAYAAVTALDIPPGAINHYNDLGTQDSRYVLDTAVVEIVRDRATGTVLNHLSPTRILAIVRTAVELARHEGITAQQLHAEIQHGAGQSWPGQEHGQSPHVPNQQHEQARGFDHDEGGWSL